MTGRRRNAAWSISTGPGAMGLHQDRDEKDTSAAVIGCRWATRPCFASADVDHAAGKTQSVTLASGDVIAFGGAARLAYHGIDRIRPGTSRLIPGGGRLEPHAAKGRVIAPCERAARCR